MDLVQNIKQQNAENTCIVIYEDIAVLKDVTVNWTLPISFQHYNRKTDPAKIAKNHTKSLGRLLFPPVAWERKFFEAHKKSPSFVLRSISNDGTDAGYSLLTALQICESCVLKTACSACSAMWTSVLECVSTSASFEASISYEIYIQT